MNMRILLLCMVMLPALASAEIYKSKDVNGTVRYSDIPPPSNVKQEALYGKKIPKPAAQPLAPVDGNGTVELNKIKADAAKASQDAEKKAPLSKDDAAAKRAQDAEHQKKADEEKQAELKLKEENCRIAKQNLATFTNGGRIVKTSEKGERAFLSDADIARGKADSQKDIDKYCN